MKTMPENFFTDPIPGAIGLEPDALRNMARRDTWKIDELVFLNIGDEASLNAEVVRFLSNIDEKQQAESETFEQTAERFYQLAKRFDLNDAGIQGWIGKAYYQAGDYMSHAEETFWEIEDAIGAEIIT
ncbi:hypothetical protein [Sulfidibacter corallicola]|uniref:Uncharacterized protein n=1 Tax=Sulfidibacter corallicola TaxID=2818388 RepID=A0A8A4TDX2_SULCO|nr:hypothetical protein [Sulfidibacter corallicola]QTD48299.1 hypothetical protein J3U87_22195 [Sulfidibacter corallicola]